MRRRRTAAREGGRGGGLLKGFLRPESSQNARQAGSGACHVCYQHFVTIPQDPGPRQSSRQTHICTCGQAEAGEQGDMRGDI